MERQIPIGHSMFGRSLACGGATGATNGTCGYRVLVSNDCGETSGRPAALLHDRKLQIFSAANTTTLAWSDPQVVLEQADTVIDLWTPVLGATSPFTLATIAAATLFRLR